MQKERELARLDSMSAIRAVEATLRRIDRRLMDHGERVAYIACTLCRFGALPLDLQTLFLLGVFHDVGAYKTDEIDRMAEFETKDVWNHAIYGYLFLKQLSPLRECAEAVLYHHASWRQIQESGTPYGDYAALLHLADRVDIALSGETRSENLSSLCRNDCELFRPEYVALFRACYEQGELLRRLSDGSYKEENAALCRRLSPAPQEALEYLKMIVFSIDFRSENTVTHSINTISLSVYLGRAFGLPEEELEDIYLAALLHDVGKIAIPPEILEFPGRLDAAQMAVMRTHVEETERLIRGVVPDEICEIAIRRHEKLDGSGYPHGRTASELTLPQRIVAVADIVSALNSRRSYKEPFPEEKAVSILTELSHTQLDAALCRYVCAHYGEMIRCTERERASVVESYQTITREFERLRRATGDAVRQRSADAEENAAPILKKLPD